MKKILYAIAMVVLSGGSVFAQQLPHFSHYSFNGMYLNPGYAGVNGQTELNVIGRYQWLNYEATYDEGGSPKTGLFTASIPIAAIKGGIGVQFYTENIGVTDVVNTQLSYSYHLNVGQGKLGIGVQGSVFNISKGTYRFNDPGDPNIPYNSSDTKFDAGAGVWYETDRYYAGVSATNLLKTKYEFEDSTKNSNGTYTGENHLYITGGYHIPVGVSTVITPTAIVKTDLNNTQFEVGARASFNDQKYWGGLGYRHQEAVTALLGIGLLKENSLRVGYAFDLTAFNKEGKAPTSHEIMLSYRLPKPANAVKPAIKTPRYSF